MHGFIYSSSSFPFSGFAHLLIGFGDLLPIALEDFLSRLSLCCFGFDF